MGWDGEIWYASIIKITNDERVDISRLRAHK